MTNVAINVDQVQETNSCGYSDFWHILRESSEGISLSYKNKLNSLLNHDYVQASKIDDVKSEADKIETAIDDLLKKFIDRSTMESKYAKKTYLNNKLPLLLTNTEMNSILENYVNDNEISSKAAQLEEYANKLAEEMTDFGGAALVGIYQSKQATESNLSD